MRRYLLLLLAMGWGYLAYGASRHFGYDRAEGYPPLSENLLWAASAALPLIIGVFVGQARTGWWSYLRWICAAALGVQTVFFLIFSWLHIYGALPLLGVVLLLWPEISGQPLHTQTKAELGKYEKARRTKRRLQYGFIAVAGLAAFIWWGWFHNPLPSDEEMIKHLNDHRAEFEQLVQGYRNYRRTDVFYTKSSAELQALANKLGIYQIQSGSTWLLNPYSEKTALIEYKCNKAGYMPGQLRSENLTIECWKQNMPELFEGMVPISWSHQIDQLSGVIQFKLGNARQPHEKSRPAHMGMRKDLWWFPHEVRVENGRMLMTPYIHDTVLIPTPHQPKFFPSISGPPVLESLDNYPPNWKAGDCVFKRIDEHWFIVMCKSAY